MIPSQSVPIQDNAPCPLQGELQVDALSLFQTFYVSLLLIPPLTMDPCVLMFPAVYPAHAVAMYEP